MADSVWAVQWSAKNEWVLVTGGCDGAIRFWDIRRAGCYEVLDQHRSQTGHRPPVLKRVTGNHGRVECLFLDFWLLFVYFPSCFASEKSISYGSILLFVFDRAFCLPL